ncbi:acetoacetate--CoA ligase [Ideonella sp. 4Y11]|uniref:Acetoacetate--CoA ligase n=1 Tax=Ideonella aquatica TaxID=2824119 RepID=A0A940YCS9_9BURK|nr:acetoacetate--CoA ligase [Ideonella aquatica]MBQ0957828.1 acetoacetate--CoA ligase [Ideonella aquatica]
MTSAQLTRFQHWLQTTRGLAFPSYDALWQWSVDDLPGFWQAIWTYFDLQSPTPHTAVLADARMPGARWFPGAQVNYAQQVLRHTDSAHAAGHPAIVWTDEAGLAAGQVHALSWPELRRQVGALAASLTHLGVGPGDRVVAFLPNRPETAVAFLACASIGAIWSVCSPDMGPVAVLDRFRQIEPAVLIATDGYTFGGVAHDRRAVVAELVAALPTLQHVVQIPLQGQSLDLPTTSTAALHDWVMLIAGNETLAPAWLPFDHPLWVVYSSGTTGLPKPIVHGHGGIVLEALKLGVLHNDIGPSAETGDRFHWYSSTGWIMWNCQVAGLLGGTTVCLFDGSPGGPHGAPDWSTLWRFAALARCSFFGAGAAFYASCAKAGAQPQQQADLSALRAVGSTGSPLSEDGYRWIWQALPQVDGRDIWIACISGGTDFAGAFIAGAPTLPVTAGEMQCRCLGARVEAWSEPGPDGRGRALIDEVGELVCTAPMPSMPLQLWNDTDGQRLHDSYFDMYPGVWRHGDWIRLVPHADAGATGAIIYGRSDATINRHGVRMGTAELYRAVEALPEVLDSLVVDLEYLGRESFMPLFVVLREGAVLDDALQARLKATIREALSPRHVPNVVLQVPAIPRTLSGKKMELPVKKLLLGADPAKVMNRDAMANAAAVDWFVDYAARRSAG